MLTHEDLAILARPFPFDDHKFNPRGFAYVHEIPIISRLDEVDLSWNFQVHETVGRNEQVSSIATLTIKGVSRSNVGMQMVEYVTDYETKEKTDREAGEPEKAATTDALRRTARLFGIGRYLLGAPKVYTVGKGKDAYLNPEQLQKFRDWLEAISRRASPSAVWTEEEVRTFVRWYRHLGVTDDEARSILKSGLREWTGTLTQAKEQVNAYLVNPGLFQTA